MKPFLTPYLWYKAMLKVWRKAWEPFGIYQLTSTANPANFTQLWPWLAPLVTWKIQKGSQDFVYTFTMTLYHQWGVKNDFSFALQFFLLIFYGLVGMAGLRLAFTLHTKQEAIMLCTYWVCVWWLVSPFPIVVQSRYSICKLKSWWWKASFLQPFYTRKKQKLATLRKYGKSHGLQVQAKLWTILIFM